MITDKFFITSGTVTGYKHKQKGRNNQDGVGMAADKENLIAVVADGCSSSKDSEVGAKLISRFVASEALKLMRSGCVVSAREILKCLQERTVEYIRKVVSVFINPSLAIDEMFLATIIGVIMNDHFTTIFSMGDGLFSLNGEIEVIDENNHPSYIGYKVYSGEYKEVDDKRINFVVRKEVFTTDVKTLTIATDGAVELQEKRQKEIKVLGKKETVGGVDQFENNDRFTKNPVLLQKRLMQMNNERTSVNWKEQEIEKFSGILSDDTTVVLIKRSPAHEDQED